MFKIICGVTTAAMVLTLAMAAHADPKKPHAKTCETFSEATTSAGQKFGICAATKPGGRPTYLSRYSIVNITDGEGKTVRVMIGYR